MKKITFSPILAAKKLLNPLAERPRSVLSERFGLQSGEPKTLESIGANYGITRERVRQIESFGLNKIRQSEQFSQLQDLFNEIASCIDENGGLVQEEHFLSSVVKHDDHKRYLLFLLVVGQEFEKIKEDEYFHRLWATDLKNAENIKKALQLLHNEMDNETLFSDKEIQDVLRLHLDELLQEKVKEEAVPLLIKISKVIEPNVFNEWGRISSTYIRPRGMRDYAFLVMKRHGSPMHFSETANAIKEIFSRPAHIQTVHNEMIKDVRFVLVGRGLYALKEWGYKDGVVRNVIEKILSEDGSLSKEEVIKKVLKERHVKENTVLVNLQNKNFFKKDTQGNYALL